MFDSKRECQVVLYVIFIGLFGLFALNSLGYVLASLLHPGRLQRLFDFISNGVAWCIIMAAVTAPFLYWMQKK